MNDIFISACVAATLGALFGLTLLAFGAPWWAYIPAGILAGLLSR